MNQRKARRTWWIKGGVGAIMLGTGLSGAIESGFLKNNNEAGLLWILTGTLSLGLVISGVVFLIQAGLIDHELRKTTINDD